MINTDQIKQDWHDRNFSFGIWVDLPGQVWSDFIHDTDELFMLMEGKVELTIGNKKFLPTIGDEILIPKNTKHTVKNIGDTESSWAYGYKQK